MKTYMRVMVGTWVVSIILNLVMLFAIVSQNTVTKSEAPVQTMKPVAPENEQYTPIYYKRHAYIELTPVVTFDVTNLVSANQAQFKLMTILEQFEDANQSLIITNWRFVEYWDAVRSFGSRRMVIGIIVDFEKAPARIGHKPDGAHN